MDGSIEIAWRRPDFTRVATWMDCDLIGCRTCSVGYDLIGVDSFDNLYY